MKTKFPKFPPEYSKDFQWSSYYHACGAWLDLYRLTQENKNAVFGGFYFVYPWIAAFCLELSIKSLAAYEDNAFNGKKYSHKSTKILEKYKEKIPLFLKVVQDRDLIELINEYENTLDTKFGQTAALVNGDDQNRMIDLALEIRKEMSVRTKLHY